MKSNFEVDVIASGSKGNATLIRVGGTAILIDAGISCRRIVKGLEACGLEPEQLGGVFLTHEHRDHIAGLEVFCRNHGTVPIYANERTWAKIPFRNKLTRPQVRVIPRGCSLGVLRIEPFAIPHDAAAPVGYQIFFGDEKCTYLTDCGEITRTVERAAEGSRILVLEANHDESMLEHGPYPWALKQRIAGNLGHLSNSMAGTLLTDLADPPEEVFLAHLSEKNNTPEVAYETVHDQLAQNPRTKGIQLFVASQNTMVSNVR